MWRGHGDSKVIPITGWLANCQYLQFRNIKHRILMNRMDVVASKYGSVEHFGPGRTVNLTDGLVQAILPSPGRVLVHGLVLVVLILPVFS